MRRELTHIVVVDVEATCWRGEPPPGQRSEIIEVGVCRLDLKTLERRDKRSILVRPALSEISEFCTELTTLRAEDFAEAVDFATACEILRDEYDSPHQPWASFGDYDRKQFDKDCEAKKVRRPFGPTHFNVKAMFAAATPLRRAAGMPAVLEALGLPLQGTHHRGHDDAWNIAAILASLLGATRRGWTER